MNSNLQELNSRKFSYYIGDYLSVKNTKVLSNTSDYMIKNDTSDLNITPNSTSNSTSKSGPKINLIELLLLYGRTKDSFSKNAAGGLSLISNCIGKATNDNLLIIPILDTSLLTNCKPQSLINYDIGICDYSG